VVVDLIQLCLLCINGFALKLTKMRNARGDPTTTIIGSYIKHELV